MDLPTLQQPLKVERSGKIVIVTLENTKLSGGEENRLAIELAGNATGDDHLLLDFTNVDFLTSVELGTLIGLHKKMRTSGGRLTLFNLSADVYEVFTTTNLHRLFGICRDPEPAIVGPKGDSERQQKV